MARTQMLNNLDSIGELVGYLTGMGEGIEEDDYIDGLIEQAHGEASNAFNVAAAATAATGRLQHVFEFGVTGITPGKGTIADPTSEAARLWVHTLTGKGGNKDIGYSFRPALQRNPQPTTASTGVPSKYLRRLSKRKYVFWNKAFVMETGMTVEIRSRQPHGLLFVPTPGNNAPRNFVMWSPRRMGRNIFATPGRRSQGTFTAFWLRWWGSVGEEIMDREMRAKVTRDIEKAASEAAKRAAAVPVKPAAANNPLSVAKRAQFAAEKAMERRENV